MVKKQHQFLHRSGKKMKVHELIEFLKKMDRNALVVINGMVVSGAVKQKGKLSNGYYQQLFRKNEEKGKVEAVLFTYLTENSLGELTHLCF
mgnify:CR=1 FL=1